MIAETSHKPSHKYKEEGGHDVRSVGQILTVLKRGHCDLRMMETWMEKGLSQVWMDTGCHLGHLVRLWRWAVNRSIWLRGKLWLKSCPCQDNVAMGLCENKRACPFLTCTTLQVIEYRYWIAVHLGVRGDSIRRAGHLSPRKQRAYGDRIDEDMVWDPTY